MVEKMLPLITIFKLMVLIYLYLSHKTYFQQNDIQQEGIECSESASIISGTISICSKDELFHSEYIPSESQPSLDYISESTVSEIIPVIKNCKVGFLNLNYFDKKRKIRT